MGGGEIVKKGWLIKSPPLDSSGIKSWRKRWFCLRSSKVLEYYKSKNGDLKGVINMENCTSVHSSLFHRKYKHVFDIETKDRTYYLVASNEEEMKNWVKTLCDLCGFLESDQSKENPSTVIKPHSSTLPSVFNVKTAPLPPVPISIPIDTSTLQYRKLSTESLDHGKHHRVEVAPGTSFTQALVAKGYTTGRTSSSSTASTSRSSQELFYSPRPSEGPPGYLDMYTTYDTPTNNSLAPPPANIGVPDWYDVPRSLMSGSPSHTRARPQASNDSDMQRPLPSRSRQWSPQPNCIYDVPPPPRSINDPPQIFPPNSAYFLTPNNIYDIPPPPVPLLSSSYQNYDKVPPPRPVNPVLPPRPPEVSNRELPLPPRSDQELPGGYAILTIHGEDESDGPPPLVDRSTKPIVPTIDRSTKPGRQMQQYSSESSEDGDEVDGHYSSESSEALDYSIQEMPKMTSRSVQYCQVTFPRKPVPSPRVKMGKTPSPNLRVDYIDVDIVAMEAKRRAKQSQNGTMIDRTTIHHSMNTDEDNISSSSDAEPVINELSVSQI